MGDKDVATAEGSSDELVEVELEELLEEEALLRLRPRGWGSHVRLRFESLNVLIPASTFS